MNFTPIVPLFNIGPEGWFFVGSLFYILTQEKISVSVLLYFKKKYWRNTLNFLKKPVRDIITRRPLGAQLLSPHKFFQPQIGRKGLKSPFCQFFGQIWCMFGSLHPKLFGVQYIVLRYHLCSWFLQFIWP